jgi:hypothetical protein
MQDDFEEFEDIFENPSTPPKDIPQPSRRTDAFAQKGIGGIKETIVQQEKREEEEAKANESNLLQGKNFREARNVLRKENHGNFLVDMFRRGLPLTEEQINTISELDLISEEELKGIKVVDPNLSEKDKVPFDKDLLQNLSGDLKSKRVGFGNYQHCGREIETKEWMPESVVSHGPEFVRWVNNMNNLGFQKKGHYEPLELYIQQAHNWLSENDNMENYHVYEDRYDYFEQEFARCVDNTLYFVEKYLYLKEADMEDASSMKYFAKPAHEVMLFLADCRYSMIIGKPRQIAATTTFLGFGLKKMMFNKNFFLKFVTMDVDTAEEIMEDKLKYPNSEIPDWLRASVYGDSHEGLHFGRRISGKKGKRGGANSKFSVVAPSVSAINAGAPPLVFVDEAGYIKVLGKMLRESRPTMFRQNQKTGELEMVRQVVIWSTGGVEEGKNKVKTKSFEEEVKHALAKWEEGSHDYGIVPIFFDWTTRPGITREFYEQEKRNYSSGSDAEREQRMNQFRLTYPSCWDDMFLSEEKLIVPISFIQENERRILDAQASFKPQPGYFEPIIDRTKQGNTGYSSSNDLGKIIGARFIPVDFDDDNASAYIFMHPEKGWLNRYYKGTDPIMTDTGYSNMASAIFDKHLGTVSAIVNYRSNDHKNTFLQTFLLGLYFNVDSHPTGVPELLEANIGTAYADFVDHMGYERTLVYKDELPDAFKGGGQMIGIDNKGKRAEFIIARLKEFVSLYHKNLYFLVIFQQLRTFSCTLTASGAAVWSVVDRRRYKDDVLYAVVFAYICSLCYDNREPRKLEGVEEKYITTYDLVRGEDGLTRVPRRKKVY